MPQMQEVEIGVGDVPLVDPVGTRVRMGDLPGAQLVVLMRHRH
jgi:hypothetical protein